MLCRWNCIFSSFFFFSFPCGLVSGEVGGGVKRCLISNVHFLLCYILKDFADSSSGVCGGEVRGGCRSGG